jgi:hypothetical protein
MLDLPWVEGGTWTAGTRSGTFGSESQHFCHEFSGQPLQLTLHTRHKLSPALVWHFHLLAQLANEHYIAKLRARELQQVSYLRAIHETGARLTHDVKNLLQSLNNLCYLAQTAMTARTASAARTAAAAAVAADHATPAANAGQAAEAAERGGRRTAGGHVVEDPATALRGPAGQLCRRKLDPEVLVPTRLFDSVADNLLQNALLKRQSESGCRYTSRSPPTPRAERL